MAPNLLDLPELRQQGTSMVTDVSDEILREERSALPLERSGFPQNGAALQTSETVMPASVDALNGEWPVADNAEMPLTDRMRYSCKPWIFFICPRW